MFAEKNDQIDENSQQDNHHEKKTLKLYRDGYDKWHLWLFSIGVVISLLALIAAIVAAKFAYDEINTIKETAQTPVRAYVLPNPFEEVWSLHGAPNTYIILRSSGVTPAKDVAFQTAIRIGSNSPIQKDFDNLARPQLVATIL
ncbi:MAG: hypothetical protein RIB59_04480, partial [Rhodospirillales bacterium]